MLQKRPPVLRGPQAPVVVFRASRRMEEARQMTAVRFGAEGLTAGWGLRSSDQAGAMCLSGLEKRFHESGAQ